MTFVPNANWLAANNALTKRPIFAVNIDGGSTWYHDFEITSGATANHKKLLTRISAIENRFSPTQSEASIGGFTFEVLRTSNIWNMEELFGAPVIVKQGFSGLDWSDFETMYPTSNIQGIDLNKKQTAWIFRCQDPQELTNRDVMTRVQKVTGQAESGGNNTLTDSTRPEAIDFWNGGTLKITEGTGAGQSRLVTDFTFGTGIFTVDSNWSTNPDNTSIYSAENIITATGTADSGTANTLVDSARIEKEDLWNDGIIIITGGTGIGQRRKISDYAPGTITVSTNWDINPDNTSEYYVAEMYIDEINPINMYLQIMTSTGNPPGPTKNGPYDLLDADQGLAISVNLIDLTEIELLRDDFMPLWEGNFVFPEAINAKSFFQDEIFRPWGITPVIKPSGLISLRLILPPLPGYMQANDMGSTLTDSDHMPLPGWKTELRDRVNRVTFNYDYNPATDTFDATVTYDDTSVTGAATQEIIFNSKGINSELNAAAITNIIANRYFQRYASLPNRITLRAKYEQQIVEPGDQLEITSDRIPNPDSNDFEWIGRTAEVLEVNPDYEDGFVQLVCQDINIGAKKYGVILPAGADDHADATATEKKTGVYVSPTLDGTIYRII
jgi:hypothetical protein